jgi:hypothetical protein
VPIHALIARAFILTGTSLRSGTGSSLGTHSMQVQERLPILREAIRTLESEGLRNSYMYK